jgi:nucleoside-diphosphate-sugar epimerase
MGFVGRRLVEMLVERGAERVVAFDIAPRPADAPDDDRIVWMQGDLTNPADVEKACRGSDCVWHIAALVGPYHPLEMYMKVNYEAGLLQLLHPVDSKTRRRRLKMIVPAARKAPGFTLEPPIK